MIKLSEEEILSLHSKLIQRYGGMDGLRDDHALDAALNTPFQTFDGIELYPTVIDKAVRLTYGLITDHPFIDGNKRIGTMAILMTLRLNHIALSYAQSELIEIMLQIASGEKDDRDLKEWVLEHQSS